RPDRLTIISPTTAPASAYGAAILIPVKIHTTEAGSVTFTNTSAQLAPMTRTDATRSGSRSLTPVYVLKNTKKKTDSATSTIFGASPTPNHRMNSGASARSGTL